MKQFVGVCAVILVFVAVTNGLECFICNSIYEADCINDPSSTGKFGYDDTHSFSPRFRCLTIHAKDHNNGEVVLRRGTVINECRHYVNKETGFKLGTKTYSIAKCEECQTDYCNDQMLL